MAEVRPRRKFVRDQATDPETGLALGLPLGWEQLRLEAYRWRLPLRAARLRPTSPPDTLQRRFLDTPGQIINHGDTITIRLNRRAYSPVLRQADIPTDTIVPWWDNRTLHYQVA
jgi:hypothetical protein